MSRIPAASQSISTVLFRRPGGGLQAAGAVVLPDRLQQRQPRGCRRYRGQGDDRLPPVLQKRLLHPAQRVQPQAIQRLRRLLGQSGQTQCMQTHAPGLAAVRHRPPDGIGQAGFQRQMAVVDIGGGVRHGVRCRRLCVQIVDQFQQFLRGLPFHRARQASAAGKEIMQLRQAQAVGFRRFSEVGSGGKLR
jgi:hypothetical protein